MDLTKRLIDQIVKARRVLARHRKVVTCMAALIVFVTTYMLILPAVTLDKSAAEESPGVEMKTEESIDQDQETQPPDAETGQQDSKSEQQTEQSNGDQKSDQEKGEADSKSDSNAVEAEESKPQNDSDEAETEQPEEKTKLKFDGKGYKVVAEVGADAKLPDDVKLEVKEVKEDTKDENGEEYAFDAYYDEAIKAVRNADGKDGKKKVRQARLFEISFVTDDGSVAEPATDVKVKLEFDKAMDYNDSGKVRVVHFDDSKLSETKAAQSRTDEKLVEKLKKDVIKTKLENADNGELKELSFESDKFSVYGVVYTVDFQWDMNGEEYDFSFPGGGYVSLGQLVEELNISGSDADKNDSNEEEAQDEQKLTLSDVEISDKSKEFVSDVESVEFSDPALIWVGKADEATTVGAIKEKEGLDVEYSADLTEDQISKINSSEIQAGDWTLISLKPFDTEETMTITMRNGDQFVIKVTDANYNGTAITNLDGATGALVNRTNNNAVLSTALNQTHLKAVRVTVSGDQITTLDDSTDLTQWTFDYVGNWNGNDHYTIRCDRGYLHLGSGSASILNDSQNLIVVTRQSNGVTEIRIANDNHDALNHTENNPDKGYGAYNNWGYNTNPGEWFTVYALSPPVINHVTVHYVDRNGNPITGVQYSGSNEDVVANEDGTFTIPYNTSGNVDLRAQFSKEGYTYGSTHLAGDGDYSDLTYDGYVIDSVLTASNGDLIYHSDSGETSQPAVSTDPGNKEYRRLADYSLSGVAKKRPSGATGQVTYAQETDKDIYVILDPVPGAHAASPSGGTDIDAAAPDLSKTMKPNDDGTYTLSLKVDAHGKNLSETNKANILFIVDTSSSMRKVTTNGHNRIEDTHDAVLGFGQNILAYNNNHPDAVQVSMITFDGSVVERLPWTTEKGTFETAVNDYLVYKYLHQGTDWEDALKSALAMCQNPPDNDPTFVVFFTDGEPSQYTNFHGAQMNPNSDPTGHYTEQNDDPGTTYPNFYSYFLSRESSKDEMRAIVDTGVQLYGIYAYNPPPASPYVSYLGSEGGAQILHNALKYGYNTNADLTNDVFFDAENTEQVQGAFDKIFNSITESVGFSNVVVEDGIAAGVTSSTVIDGDVSGFTYIIRDNNGDVAYKVTVAPNGVPGGQTVEDGTPIFTIGSGPPVVGEKKTVSTTKVKKDASGQPIPDDDGKIQTETADVEVYYYKDANNKEYIMPISTTGENVSWDLSPLGLLKDGYSYEVNFVVWPNQESYDIVADLNNGKRPDIESTANWNNCPIKTDSAGRQYRQGGFPDYPYISRYEDNGVYSAMSNTDQKVDYYKFDKKIKDGEEITVITHGSKDVPPPDPMPLTASYSRLEKLWNVERDPGIFAQYLYNTNGTSKQFKVDFDVFQGSDLEHPYTTESLGWDPAANNGQGGYVWAPGDTMTNVTYAGHPVQIGTRWVTDFSIATGLMLTNGEMERLGLNKSLYPSAELDGVTYYILEPGHDYTIKEHIPEGEDSNIGYEFDFESPVYHPMLVDGVLKNVEVKYTYKTVDGKKVIDTATLTSITGSEEGLSGLKVENTLRGYINLNKIVVDEEGDQVESDNTKFEYTIKLESPTSPGPFEGDHIPWFGINGLYYNDGNEKYYQVYEAQGGTWMIKNEAGREYEVTSTGFDPDKAEEQTVTYTVNGHEKTIKLYGNQMTASANGTIAEATLSITQKETLYIANVPVGTEYTITEANTDDYTLIDILKEVKNGTDVEKSEHVTDLSERTAEGTIVTNRDNHVTYKNKVLTGALKITKEIRKNGTKDTSATGTFYYAVYDKEYDPNADPAMEPVRTGHIDVTSGGTAEITEPDLKIGKYYVYELTGEGGTPVTGEGTFIDGKYYAVTTTGSPATVTLGNTSTAGIVNNYETIPVTATKSWADNNPDHLTVYFKLFYKNAAGVDVTTGKAMKELPYGTTSVTWDEMPKYDENGNEYNYIVREYVLDEENGEYSEGGHKYTEAAPNGYVNTEAGLTVTNSKLETYDPVTTYSGIKLWVDTANGGRTRPDGLDVKLMIDKEPFNNPTGDIPAVDKDGKTPQLAWVAIDEDEWKYTFHNLPMFDENKQIINYYAVETPVAGYKDSVTQKINTKYEYKSDTLDHTENDAYPVMSSDADLVYCAVMIQHEGHLHHIWTQRVPTDEEKNRLVQLVNADLVANNLSGNATVDNVRWVNGLPINHEFVWKAQPNGYKVSFTRYNTNTIHIKVDNHGAFSNICYGTLKYDYTAGSTDFKNELKPVSHNVEKAWADGKNPPEGAVIVLELLGTVKNGEQTVPVDLSSVGVTEHILVTLNGGKEGGDDTAAKPWKYTWSDLPPCDKAGKEITYSVREVSYSIGGHTVSLHDFAPTMDNSTPGTTEVTNQIPSYSFEVLKTDAVTASPLQGAKFTIREIRSTSNVVDPTYVGDAAASDPETTGTDGIAGFDSIPFGYYEVEETKLPTGYSLTQEQDGKFYIRVDTDGIKLLRKVIAEGDTQPKLTFTEVQPGAGGRIILGNVELTKTGNKFVLTVENTRGASLPSSGGPGTTWMYILGMLMVVGAGMTLAVRRRMRAY